MEIIGIAFFIFVFLFILNSKIRKFKRSTHVSEEDYQTKLRENDFSEYPHGWYRLANNKDVEIGQIIKKTLCGKSYAVTKTKDDELRVYDEHCPHNKASLCKSGFVKDGNIVCGFHEWEFGIESGQCVNIPYGDEGSNEKLICSTKLKGPITRKFYDGIVVWYHPENLQPLWEPEEDKKITEEMIFMGEFTSTIACLVDDIHENSADLAHFNYVHKKNKITIMDNVWTDYSWDHKGHVGDGAITSTVKIFGYKIFSLKAFWRNVGPGIITTEASGTFGRFVIIDTTTPRDRLLTERDFQIYCPPHLPSSIAWFMCWCFFHVTLQDLSIWNHKKVAGNPIYTASEKELAKFRRWFKGFYNSGSARISLKLE